MKKSILTQHVILCKKIFFHFLFFFFWIKMILLVYFLHSPIFRVKKVEKEIEKYIRKIMNMVHTTKRESYKKERSAHTNKGESMSSDLMVKEDLKQQELSIIEQVVMQGDLSKLDSAQRVVYYRKVCESAGLNPFTRPFDYISLNGKLTLYAKKDATEQLRKLNGISIEKLESKIIDDLYIVKATARTRDGRVDEATGAVTIGNLKGDAKANAIMKAETKAKRRVTLSISGMGWTDETEIESIPNAKTVHVDLSTGELKEESQPIVIEPPKQKITMKQAAELEILLKECSPSYKKFIYESLKKEFNSENLHDLPVDSFEKTKSALIKNKEKYHAKKLSLISEAFEPESVTLEVQ